VPQRTTTWVSLSFQVGTGWSKRSATDPAPELERGPDPDVERAGQADTPVRQDRHRLAGLEVDAGVESGWLRGRQPVACMPGAEPGWQRCEPRLERGDGQFVG
jgi:hypothetical protein